jgi:hypothetical protein
MPELKNQWGSHSIVIYVMLRDLVQESFIKHYVLKIESDESGMCKIF